MAFGNCSEKANVRRRTHPVSRHEPGTFTCQKAPDFARRKKRANGQATGCPTATNSFQQDAIYTPLALATREIAGAALRRRAESVRWSAMDYVALQEKIGRIDGVEAARVVTENGQVDEIHVLARRNKAPKQLVRDVQSLGQALFGIDIDRRVVSVVQLADADLDGGIRPALVDVSEAIEGTKAEVTVTLRWQDNLLLGTAAGAAAAATRPRQIAEATLEAVRQAIHDSAALAISSTDVATLGSRKIAVAQVVLVTEAGERMLIGSAYADDDETKAVVRAVLDALNRLLPDLKVS